MINKNLLENIIAGPCSAESRNQIFNTATKLKELGINTFRAGVWKPRTKPGGFEGIGEPALQWLEEIKNTLGINPATEIANKEQLCLALKYGINTLWIGARTTANPFAVQEIADFLSTVGNKDKLTILIKNPVCPDIDLWEGALLRIQKTGVANIGLIHRGFKVYEESKYRNEPLWRIPLDLHVKYPNIKMYCDPSHISGNKEYVEEISNLAINTYGFDGLIVESHCDPSCAWTDAKQQVTPNELNDILTNISKEDNNLVNDEELLDSYRKKIDYYDEHLIYSLEERLKISKLIGEYKKTHNMKTYQKGRWQEVLSNIISLGNKHGLDENYIKDIWNIIHEKSIEVQK